MPACASQSQLAKWYFDAAGATFSGTSERWAFRSDSVRKSGTVIASDVILGTRADRMESAVDGPYSVAGTLVTDWTPAFADKWLPRILGAAESSDTFGTAEFLPEFDMICDRVGGVFKYSGCKVGKATLRGRKGGLIEVSLDIMGKTEATGVSPPTVALGYAAIDSPYQFADCVLAIHGSARKVFDFELTIDNQIVAEGYNSLTAQCLLEQGRIVNFTTNTAFNSTEMSALYDKGAAAAAAVTITMTRGGFVCTGTLSRFQPTAQSPIVEGPRGEIKLPLSGIVRGTAGGAEISFTNDVTA